MSVLRPDIPDSIDSGFAGLVDASESGWYLNDLNEYFRGFPVSADDVVLDVGCGAGAATIFSAQRGAKVIYSDVVGAVVDELTEKLKLLDGTGECLPLVCDSAPLLVEDETATRIVCSEVLEHVDDPAQVMEELVRVGKPGALYLLTVPGEKGEKIQRNFAPSSYFEKPNHIRIFSRDDFETLVEKAGLSIQSYSATGFFKVMWMSIHWAVEAASGGSVDASATHRKILPPFDDSLDRWSALWVKLISTPEGLAFKHQMDELLPKNQVVVAKKDT
jgi:ubiquinone/menaquinone biosynthesis C-methylase UbiE